MTKRGKNSQSRKKIAQRIESELWVWRENCRLLEGRNVTKAMIQSKAKWAFRRNGMTHFKASDGWYWRWLKNKRKPNLCVTSSIKTSGEMCQSSLECHNPTAPLEQLNLNPAADLNLELPSHFLAGKLPADVAVEAQECVKHLRHQNRVPEFQHFPEEEGLSEQNMSLSGGYHETVGMSSIVSPGGLIDLEMPDTCCRKLDNDTFRQDPSADGFEFAALGLEAPFSLDQQQQIEASNVLEEEDLSSLLCKNHQLTQEEDAFNVEEQGGKSNLSSSDLEKLSNELDCSGSMRDYNNSNQMRTLPSLFYELGSPSEQFQSQANKNLSLLVIESTDSEVETVDRSLSFAFESHQQQQTQQCQVSLMSPSTPNSLASLQGEWTTMSSSSPCSTASSLSSACWSPPTLPAGLDSDPCFSSPNSLHLSVENSIEETYSPENFSSFSQDLAANKSRSLTVIEAHRRLGKRSLQDFKDKVLHYARDHTFKETGRNFGIHHSTVSCWVKAKKNEPDFDPRSSKQSDVLQSPQNKSSSHGNRAEEAFIMFLQSVRQSGNVILTPDLIRQKLSELSNIYREEMRGMDPNVKGLKNNWFPLYLKRCEEKSWELSEEYTAATRESQSLSLSYPPAFKLEVALYAEKNSQYKASKVFFVARRRIFDWMQQTEKLKLVVQTGVTKKVTSGRNPLCKEVDKDLYDWYVTQTQQGQRPRSRCVQFKAKKMYRAAGFVDMKCSYGWFKRWAQRFNIQLRHSVDNEMLEWILKRFDENVATSQQDLQSHCLFLTEKQDKSFKASAGWASRFCSRYHQLLNPNLSFLTSQTPEERILNSFCVKRLPGLLEDNARNFSDKVSKLIKDKQIKVLACADELFFNFAFLSSKVCSNHGQIAIKEGKPHSAGMSMQGCSSKQSCVSVFLAITSDGTCLPPLICFKKSFGCKNLALNVGYQLEGLDSFFMFVEDFNSETCTQSWMELVWNNQPFSESKKLLLLDSFDPHCNPKLEKVFSTSQTFLELIPLGTSERLQPLLMGFKNQFKVRTERIYLEKFALCKDPNFMDIIKIVEETFQVLKKNQDDIKDSFSILPIPT